jgi:hypothetical protein
VAGSARSGTRPKLWSGSWSAFYGTMRDGLLNGDEFENALEPEDGVLPWSAMHSEWQCAVTGRGTLSTMICRAIAHCPSGQAL